MVRTLPQSEKTNRRAAERHREEQSLGAVFYGNVEDAANKVEHQRSWKDRKRSSPSPRAPAPRSPDFLRASFRRLRTAALRASSVSRRRLPSRLLPRVHAPGMQSRPTTRFPDSMQTTISTHHQDLRSESWFPWLCPYGHSQEGFELKYTSY